MRCPAHNSSEARNVARPLSALMPAPVRTKMRSLGLIEIVDIAFELPALDVAIGFYGSPRACRPLIGRLVARSGLFRNPQPQNVSSGPPGRLAHFCLFTQECAA